MECTCRHVLVTVVVVLSIGFLCTVSEAASTAAAPPATEAVTGGTLGATENATTENPTTVQASTANGTTKAVTTETATVNGTDGTTQVITELATTVNGTEPAATTANNGTDAATTHKTPQTPGTDKPTSNPNKGSGSGFDAASFIGGIVLAAGVIAIGFFGFKFYKSRQEGKNYQQF